MKTKTKAMLLVLTIGATALTGTSAANAVTRGAEGGTWAYGVGRTTYSDYYHPRQKHGSTACNALQICDRKVNVKAGQWSRASIWKTWSGNTAYFHRS